MLLQLETLSMEKGAYIDDDEFRAKSLFSCCCRMSGISFCLTELFIAVTLR